MGTLALVGSEAEDLERQGDDEPSTDVNHDECEPSEDSEEDDPGEDSGDAEPDNWALPVPDGPLGASMAVLCARAAPHASLATRQRPRGSARRLECRAMTDLAQAAESFGRSIAVDRFIKPAFLLVSVDRRDLGSAGDAILYDAGSPGVGPAGV